MTTPADVEARLREFADTYRRITDEVRRVIVGHDEILEGVLLCLLTESHALLEGVPGIGKTLLVRTLAEALDLEFRRIQFTPDLMPADIVGTNVIVETLEGRRDWEFRAGPVFGNLILADEINRATPKTQSALLEAMQEKRVTVSGTTYDLKEPFLVMATQNPLEMEGTYPLPEAQIDRFFFKVLVGQPTEVEMMEIINRTVGVNVPYCQAVLSGEELSLLQRTVREVIVPAHVVNYAVRIVLGTQPEQIMAPQRIQQFVRYGAGPRGAQALIHAAKARALTLGRFNASLDDVRAIARPALRHRIALNFDGQSEGLKVDDLIVEVLEYLPVDKNRPSALAE